MIDAVQQVHECHSVGGSAAKSEPITHCRATNKVESASGKQLSDFEHGYLCAMAQLIRLHDKPSMAADCLHHDGLGALDCSELEEFDKAPLRALFGERNMHLTGLEPNDDSSAAD